MKRTATDILARNGEMIYVGDIVETVQGTIFLVRMAECRPAECRPAECRPIEGKFYLETKDGWAAFRFWDFEPHFSPNLWIIGRLWKDANLLSWTPSYEQT